MQHSAFDASAIADTVGELRRIAEDIGSEPLRLSAELIERLWAEVEKLSAPEYVPPVSMTESDKSGPFLGKNVVDLEFYDEHGHDCGSSSVELEMRINDRGILIISKTRTGFKAASRLTLGGYRFWIGSDLVEAKIDPVSLLAGDTYLIALNLPIRLGRDIGHNPGDDSGPPRPTPPELGGDVVKQRA